MRSRSCLILNLFLGAALCLASAEALAFASGVWNYLKKYQLGFDYTNSYDAVTASYETAKGSALGPECKDVRHEADRQRCQVQMTGGASSGWGIFLQQAFKRQGFFYFDVDVGFGARYLEGKLDKKDKTRSQEAGLPLKDMRFSLGAAVIKPYVQFGITPAKTWPDILVSLGPAAQLAMGTVTVNDKKEPVAVGTSSSIIGGFFEVEVVFWRFGEGALSIFTSKDFTGGTNGSRFYPKTIDGMDDIRADFSRSVSGMFGVGLKILLDWP